MSGTVGKALTLLEHLSRYDAPVRLAELSRAIDMNKSTTYRLLETLAQMGYVTQDEPNGRYMMTVKMWEIGVRAFQRSDLRQMARPHLQAITAAVNETALLTRVGIDDVIIIEKVDCVQSLQAVSPLGSRSPIHASSFGKAYLMQQPAEVIHALADPLQGFTPTTITNRDALLAQLSQMREKGYAIGRGEYREGISGIAAPVIGTDGKVYATLGVSMPSFRLTTETEESIVTDLSMPPKHSQRNWAIVRMSPFEPSGPSLLKQTPAAFVMLGPRTLLDHVSSRLERQVDLLIV